MTTNKKWLNLVLDEIESEIAEELTEPTIWR
jgi:hypothetical protein